MKIKKIVFSLSTALPLIFFAGCGSSDSDGGSRDNRNVESKELLAANKITGEYTGKADVNWSMASEGIVFGEEEIADLKISIAHSGDDNDKQLLFRVEKVAVAAADAEESAEEDSGPESFCVILKNFSIKESGQTVEFLVEDEVEGSQKSSKGEIKDVGTLSEIKLSGEKLSLKVDQEASIMPAEEVTNLVRTGSGPSFADLSSSCNL